MQTMISGHPLVPIGSVRAAGGSPQDVLISYQVDAPTGTYRFVPLPNDARYLIWNDDNDWEEVFDSLDQAIAAVDQIERSHHAKATVVH